MVFFFTTISQQGENREFSIMGDLEAGFSILDYIGKRGDILLKAPVVDGHRTSELPLDSFYGSTSLPGMEALEQDWTHILSKPVNIRSVCAQLLPDLIARRVERHKICIGQLEQAVVLAELRLQHVSDTIHGEPHRTRMLNQLEMVLKRHRENLSTEQASLYALLDQSPH
ncbi:hypothetical protein [Spirosoma endbachense]|uniref:Uncharacterized protein n=1 Tax=Spirosoma endbachense TaxID=2666025 RepID=A0A6P1VY45_9BACT|nr:hypothetical protein [Spirosoma endbachense]QHV96316.1 hypothetical protein GJR95_15385 [Spirosoma endbachense]